jgi:hypothetical protein
MSISSTGLYGSATIVNSDLFNDVSDLKEQVTTLSTSCLGTTREHRIDISLYIHIYIERCKVCMYIYICNLNPKPLGMSVHICI